MKTLVLPAAFAALAFGSNAALAGPFVQADFHDGGVWSGYSTDTQTYVNKYDRRGSDGFWLVVSDGENPKTNTAEYAILYGDLENNRLTAYEYSGENNANSYRETTYLGTYENAFMIDEAKDRVGFNIDVSGINGADLGPDWDGVTHGDQAGIWFHRTTGTEFDYADDGSIENFFFDSQTFVDVANNDTFMPAVGDCSGSASDLANRAGLRGSRCDTPTQITGGAVPAPGGPALLIAGLLALVARRRAK